MGSKLSALVFQPPPTNRYARSNGKKRRHHVTLTGKKGESVSAFYIDRKSKLTFLFSHGNAEDLEVIYEWFCEFSKEIHVNVFAYDYEGYGQSVSGQEPDDIPSPVESIRSSSATSEEKCYANIELAYEYLTNTLNIPSEHILLYGRSLGSGPSCYLAQKLAVQNVKLGGLVLQSPVLSIYRVVLKFRFTLPYDLFPNIDRLPHVSCPVFVIHGTRDEIVPFWHGEELFLAVPVPLRAKPNWVQGGGHNDLEFFAAEGDDETYFLEQFREFLLEWVPAYHHSFTALMAKP
jgi:fermentation-respiration switch protein FrsA (DUF1100 family)